jgi:hypothetical protein
MPERADTTEAIDLLMFAPLLYSTLTAGCAFSHIAPFVSFFPYHRLSERPFTAPELLMIQAILMIKLTDYFEQNRKTELGHARRRRVVRAILLLLMLAVAGLLTERLRGQWTLKRWKDQMAAKGEKLDVSGLWPAPNAESSTFSNQLAKATETREGKLREFAGSISPILANERGNYRRGSQEAQPQMAYRKNSTNTWQELDEAINQNEAALASLRELMKNPPPTMSRDVVKEWANNSPPNFVSVRIGAQSLHAAAINDLHKGDLTHALENLLALEAFARLYEDDPGLVNDMIRIAIIGLGVEVSWDALQADGWTQSQLATLQQGCADSDKLLAQMPKTLEGIRVERIYELRLFRSHSYKAWIEQNQAVFESFGCMPPACDTAPTVLWWRQCVFHPLWSFAWADQEELDYLNDTQLEVTALRDAVQKRAWSSLNQQLITSHKGYRAPAAKWRFYTRLPMVDVLADLTPSTDPQTWAYPYTDFTKAWYTTMKTLTQHEILITAIALKRFELQNGSKPSSLNALIPEFLPALPTDFIDGHPLRYRLNSDGTYALYSVGDNLIDDGGIGILGSGDAGAQKSPWNGQDWVWPVVHVGNKNGQIVQAKP